LGARKPKTETETEWSQSVNVTYKWERST
jgi:hypothetical protein